MSRRAVNIATISEEDVLGEEIGEDGTVAMVSSDRLSRESFDYESDVNGWSLRSKNDREEDLERSDSVVENESNDGAEVSSSILSAISSIEGTLPRRTSAKSSSPKSSQESLRSLSPGRPRTPALTGPPSNLKRNFSWRGGGRSIGTTLNLSGKFVTELTLYNPVSGPVKSNCINLGVFIATDQTMGDHSVYKISPMSPLNALKILQQDRLLKVNDISVMGWSHSCLLEFIRNLPLAPSKSEATKDSAYEMQLSMEFRKSGKVIRTTEESPGNRRVAASVKIIKQRATVLSVHESVVRVRCSSSYNARLMLNDDLSLCLTTTTSSNNTVSLTVTELASLNDNEGSFRIHQYDVSPPRIEKGEIVVIETPAGDGYIHATSLETIGVMQGLTAPPSTFQQTDVRFFHIVSADGGSYFRIKNLHTGHYLSAVKNKVNLVSSGTDLSLPTETLFEIQRTDR